MKRLSDSEEQRSKQISFTVISHCRCRWCWFASRWLHSTHISQVSCVAFSHFADLYSFKFDMSVLTSVPNHSVQMLCVLERWPTRVTQICFFLFYHLYICADQLLQLAAHCWLNVAAARCAIPSTFGPSSPHFHSVWWRWQWDMLGCHGGTTTAMMRYDDNTSAIVAQRWCPQCVWAQPPQLLTTTNQSLFSSPTSSSTYYFPHQSSRMLTAAASPNTNEPHPTTANLLNMSSLTVTSLTAHSPIGPLPPAEPLPRPCAPCAPAFAFALSFIFKCHFWHPELHPWPWPLTPASNHNHHCLIPSTSSVSNFPFHITRVTFTLTFISVPTICFSVNFPFQLSVASPIGCEHSYFCLVWEDGWS